MHQLSKTLFAVAVAFGVSGAAGAQAQSTPNTPAPVAPKTPSSAVQSDKKPVTHSAHKSEAPSEAGVNTKQAAQHKDAQPSAAKPAAPTSGVNQPAGAAVHSEAKNKSHAQPVKTPSTPSDTSATKGSSK